MKILKHKKLLLIIFILISFLGGMQKVYYSIPTRELVIVDNVYATDMDNDININTEELEIIVEEPEPFDYSTLVNEEDIKVLGNAIYGEARGLKDTEKAAVVWCILNRYDTGKYGNTIKAVVSAKNQFSGYNAKRTYNSEAAKALLKDCEAIAKDVLIRYYMEKDGIEDVGRVLPSTYLYFIGDGKHNYFSEIWKSKAYWNWSLESPYEVN